MSVYAEMTSVRLAKHNLQAKLLTAFPEMSYYNPKGALGRGVEAIDVDVRGFLHPAHHSWLGHRSRPAWSVIGVIHFGGIRSLFARIAWMTVVHVAPQGEVCSHLNLPL
jgi:hypothetical protein